MEKACSEVGIVVENVASGAFPSCFHQQTQRFRSVDHIPGERRASPVAEFQRGVSTNPVIAFYSDSAIVASKLPAKARLSLVSRGRLISKVIRQRDVIQTARRCEENIIRVASIKRAVIERDIAFDVVAFH